MTMTTFYVAYSTGSNELLDPLSVCNQCGYVSDYDSAVSAGLELFHQPNKLACPHCGSEDVSPKNEDASPEKPKKGLFSWIKSFFGGKKKHPIDPYAQTVALEAIRTGNTVVGQVDDNGNLNLTYAQKPDLS